MLKKNFRKKQEIFKVTKIFSENIFKVKKECFKVTVKSFRKKFSENSAKNILRKISEKNSAKNSACPPRRKVRNSAKNTVSIRYLYYSQDYEFKKIMPQLYIYLQYEVKNSARENTFHHQNDNFVGTMTTLLEKKKRYELD